MKDAIRRRRLILGVVALPALLLGGAAGATMPGPDGPGSTDQAILEHVGRVPFTSWNAGNVRAGQFTVVKLDAEGKPICVKDDEGECVVDEDGNIVYEMEDRDYAFAAAQGPNRVEVFDITNPAGPFHVTEVPGVVPAVEGALDIRADLGLLVVVRSTSLAIVDISDPRFPTLISSFGQSGPGPHSVTLHPTQPYAYVPLLQLAPSVGQLAVTPIVDLTNPASPTRVQNFAFHVQSPHTLTFNATGTRAYAPSTSHTDIWNTSDPRNPSVVTTIHDPTVKFHSYAQPSPDGRYLTVTDNLGSEVTCPGGFVHFYDLTVEAAPVKVAAFAIEPVATTNPCAPNYHAFQGSLMAVPWRFGGTRLLDVSNPIGTGGTEIARSDPGLSAQPEGAIFYKGHILALDRLRGLDIFRLPST